MGAKRLCLEDCAAETVKHRAAGLGVYIALNTEGRRYLTTPAMVLALPVVSAWSWYNVVGCDAVKAVKKQIATLEESPKSGSRVFPSHLQLQSKFIEEPTRILTDKIAELLSPGGLCPVSRLF